MKNETTGYSFAQLRLDVSSDIAAYLRYADEYREAKYGALRIFSALLIPSVYACLLYRLSHWFHCRRWYLIAMFIARLNLLITRVSIAPSSEIGGGLYIAHPNTGIVFQGTAGSRLSLFAGSAVLAAHNLPLGQYHKLAGPVIGNNVALGAKALVVGKLTIGDNVKVGLNTYVSSDVPPDSIVISRHIRNRVVKTADRGRLIG